MTIKIIGAGMAGLLAANMLRSLNPIVIEERERLPNNHSAVLRFRSTIVGDVLGIPFKRVKMIKAPLYSLNPIADALHYSLKNTGVRRSDRSIIEGMVAEDRYIAPPDLIERMAEGLDIRYGERHDFNARGGEKVISTVPMPVLAKALGHSPHIKFEYSAGVNIKATIKNCDAYVSLLVPDPRFKFSRISITGNELIVEIPREMAVEGEPSAELWDILNDALQLIGVVRAYDPRVYNQHYSKILPIDEDERKNFIHWASVTKGVAYQLGRFATWRPGLLLDDLVKDVRIIEGWIRSKSSDYDQHMLHNRRA